MGVVFAKGCEFLLSGISTGGCSEGGALAIAESSSAIASEVSNSRKDSLAMTDFFAKKTQGEGFGVEFRGGWGGAVLLWKLGEKGKG